MKAIYFDCFSGISGDMIIGSLIDLGLDFKYLQSELKKLKLKGYYLKFKKTMKGGIACTKFDVIIPHQHEYEDPKGHNITQTQKHAHHDEKNLKEINSVIEKSELDKGAKQKIKQIFLKIAAAESKIHNKPIDKIHFHEIGAIDTILDVAGAVIGFRKLGIEKIYCSKLNVGTGFVEFSHGKWPVPAPATAEILKKVPVYSNKTESELVTPTGAAIITTLANRFGEMPLMEIEKIGYGAGARDLGQPNVLRAFLGKIKDNSSETINVIETNIDNMNPEIFPYVIDKLMKHGAFDAYLTNIMMKKGRPAIKLTMLAETKDTDKLCHILFEETTTLGVRIYAAQRKKLDREIKSIKTKYGNVRVKISKLGNNIQNIMPEYEDCVKIAKKYKIALKRVYDEVKPSKI